MREHPVMGLIESVLLKQPELKGWEIAVERRGIFEDYTFTGQKGSKIQDLVTVRFANPEIGIRSLGNVLLADITDLLLQQGYSVVQGIWQKEGTWSTTLREPS